MTGSGLYVFWLHASGDQVLPQRSIRLESAAADTITGYTVGFTIATPGTLGSVELQFCSNDPLVEDPCTVPIGLDVSAATLDAQSGETGFAMGAGTDTNTIILSRAPASSTAQPVSYSFSNVHNPSSIGSYYVRLTTYATTDASGARTDHGGLAFAINDAISITSKVPPYLLFCSGITITSFDCDTASGSYINFGNFSTASTAQAQTQLVAASNAEGGYNLTYQGTSLTSGNNVIPGMNPDDVSRPGVSQFGLNLRANTDPGIGVDIIGPGPAVAAANYATPNRYLFNSGDIFATTSGTSDYNKFTLSYIVNISTAQPAGIYVSTLTYVATANF